jgi:hypothetical protein
VRFGVASVVALAVLVLLPLAAVWLAGRWRDPPRDRWALTAPAAQEELSAPGLAEFRIRRTHGIRDESRWAAVRRAVDRGEPAPPDLRPAAAEWARAQLAQLDAQLTHRVARSPLVWLLWLLALAAGVTVGALLVNGGFAAIYAGYSAVLAALNNPWRLTRRRTRTETALTANS